jgi:hypothetical protein
MIDEIGGTCSIHETNEKWIQNSSQENLKERNHVGNPGVDGSVLLQLI